MASLEHRRVLSAVEAGAHRPKPFHARLPLTAWLFVAAAVVWLAWELRPLLAPGALDAMDLPNDATFVARILGDASTIALPAALAFGYPGVSRRNRWLWYAAVTMASARLAQDLLTAASGWILEIAEPFTNRLYDATARAGVNVLVDAVWLLPLIGFALVAVSMWMLAKGLADAGARPSRLAVIAIAAVGLGLALLSIAPLFLGDAAPVELDDQLRLGLTIPITLGIVAFSFVASLRLVIGWWTGLVPARAWAIGAAWGVLTIGIPVIAMAMQSLGPRGSRSGRGRRTRSSPWCRATCCSSRSPWGSAAAPRSGAAASQSGRSGSPGVAAPCTRRPPRKSTLVG